MSHGAELAVAVTALLRARMVFYRLPAKALVTRLQGADRKARDPALGSDPPPDPEAAAHAWIYCQGMPVAGGEGTGFEVLIGPGAG